MRWKVKPKEYSDIRRRKKFLLIPATAGDETRTPKGTDKRGKNNNAEKGTENKAR